MQLDSREEVAAASMDPPERDEGTGEKTGDVPTEDVDDLLDEF